MRRSLFVATLLIGMLAAAYACISSDTPENDSLRNGDAGMTGQLNLTFRDEFELAYGKPTKSSREIDVVPGDAWRAINEIADLIAGTLSQPGVPTAAQDAWIIWLGMEDYLLGMGAFGEIRPEARAAGEKLPACYRHYLRSLNPDREVAMAAIEDLLALPPSERRPLEAVAWYRRGRLLEHAIRDKEQREKAGKESTLARLAEVRKSLEAVETAVANGSPDVAFVRAAALHSLTESHLGLPAACGGMLEDEISHPKAAELLLRQHALGFGSGADTLRRLMSDLSRSLEGQMACRDDVELRRLMTMFLCSRAEKWAGEDDEPGLDEAIGRWLSVIGDIPLPEGDENLGRIALLYYQHGSYAMSEKVVARCRPDDPMAAMLRSRLELRVGRRLEAAKALERALPKLGEVRNAPSWYLEETLWQTWQPSAVWVSRSRPNSLGGKLRAELAMLKLSLGDYPGALRTNLAAGMLRDSLYVAECVMTIDELKAFVDAEAMGKRVRKRGWGEYDEKSETIDLHEELRVLLARRLSRAERWLEAKQYARPGMAAVIDAYLGYVAKGEDGAKADRERADAYWRASLLIREHGRELLYCDFGPRWTTYQWTSSGSTDGWIESEWPRCRIEPTQEHPWQPLTGPGQDERDRVKAWLAANPAPGNRHGVLMKYRVFDLGMKAVALLPDNDPAGAKIAQFIGVGLAVIDPPYANSAYKALATRFNATPHGKHAFEKRWFMRTDDEPNPDWVTQHGPGPGR